MSWADALLGLVDDAVVMVTSEGRVVRWNLEAEKLFERTSSEAIGKLAFEIWPEPGRASAIVGDPSSPRAGSATVEWTRSDSSTIGIEIRRAAPVASDGSPLGVIVNARPVNLGHWLIERLRESEERFRLSFENSPVGKALVGLDGRFLSVNPALCELLGTAEPDLLEAHFNEVTFTEDIEKDLENARRLRRGDISRFENEKRFVRPDGREMWFQIHVSLVRNRAGQPLYYITQVHDVTERHKHGVAMKEANDQLQLLNELRTRFLANVSHELQSPLTVILGYSDLLSESAGSPDPETLEAALDAISRQARRLKRLVTDLVALTRLEAGVSIEPQVVELSGLVETVLQDCAQDRALWEFEAPDEANALADPDRLAQIVANLIANAEQYGRAPFLITIDASAASNIVITVADHGDGVPDEFAPLLFERFTRNDQSRRSEGSGLGLAISQGLARAQGGDVTYRRHEPRGASFVVTVPRVGKVT